MKPFLSRICILLAMVLLPGMMCASCSRQAANVEAHSACITGETASGVGSKADANVCVCSVCAYNRDFSCMTVKVDDETPRALFEGKTYCFCGCRCQEEFKAHPQRYIKAAKRAAKKTDAKAALSAGKE